MAEREEFVPSEESNQELLQTYLALPSEEQSKMVEHFPQIKMLLEEEAKTEAELPKVNYTVSKTSSIAVEYLTPSEKQLLGELRGRKYALTKEKMAELESWFKKIEAELAKKEEEEIPQNRTTPGPLSVSSSFVDGTRQLKLEKEYNTHVFHKDTVGNIIEDSYKIVYSTIRNILQHELDCITKVKEDNKISERHWGTTVGDVKIVERIPFKSQVLSVFLCSPEQGFIPSTLAEILGLEKTQVRSVLEALVLEQIEITTPSGEKIKSPILRNTPECYTYNPEKVGAPEPEIMRYKLAPPKKVCTTEFFGEKSYKMDLAIRQHFSKATAEDLSERFKRWWEAQPVKFAVKY